MYSKIESLRELYKLNGDFLCPEMVDVLGEPFGVTYSGEGILNSDLAHRGYRNGQIVPGMSAESLAKKICRTKQIEFPIIENRLIQFQTCCDIILEHIKTELSREHGKNL